MKFEVGDLVRLRNSPGLGLIVDIKHMTKVKIAKVEWSNGCAGHYGLRMLERVSK